ncbi:hypothetical protein ALO82_200156 [Pseudomonas syringae pv. broussonetiae]|nr:hypothetical protein ALO82_200156 [Pseudomonas syringae pv. broussonetiae]
MVKWRDRWKLTDKQILLRLQYVLNCIGRRSQLLEQAHDGRTIRSCAFAFEVVQGLVTVEDVHLAQLLDGWLGDVPLNAFSRLIQLEIESALARDRGCLKDVRLEIAGARLACRLFQDTGVARLAGTVVPIDDG